MHNFNTQFLLYYFFFANLLPAVYFVFILGYENDVRQKADLSIFLFEFKMGRKVAETTRKINKAFGSGTANKRMVQWWLRSFVYVPQLSYPFIC